MIVPIVHHPASYDLHLGRYTFPLTGFGLAVVAAFAIAQIIGERELERRGHDSSSVADMMIAAMFGGLLGAKLYFVVILGNYDALFTRGGFVFWGGLIGGILSVMAVIHWKKIPQMRIFDVGGPAVAAAYAVGRTGCWAVGDDYGRPWNGFLAVAFPDGSPPSSAANMVRDFHVAVPPGTDPMSIVSVYPTQLFEVTLGLIMFLILWRLRDHRHAQGWLFGVYCVLAGIERFVIEFFRAKDDRLVGLLTYAQLIALVFIAMGVAWMYARRRVTADAPGIYAAGAAD
jgi:phosphatidylglycerol---prolipoprotein diacylglyceryl transferase